MSTLFPEKPILIYPSLAATIGLEGATLLAVLKDISTYLRSQQSQGYDWFYIPAVTLNEALPFWDILDIQRVSQQLRDLGLILLRSAPYSQSQSLDFSFNQQANTQSSDAIVPTTQRNISSSASLIAANWQPDGETLGALAQLNIPEHFAREQVPEFVRYWRESGETQRAWGSKFIQYVKRQWAFHNRQMSRRNQAIPLPQSWQPSAEVQGHIASEGIPTTFAQKVLNKFCLYHRSSGTTHLNWDMPYYSWVKDAWQKQDTPFIESQSLSMHPQWQPDKHTVDYLNSSYGIPSAFVSDCVAEFVHKWIEKKAVYSEWGKIFAEHVIEQWRFVQAGVERNPQRMPIPKNWRPSQDCLHILQEQSGVKAQFINQQISEFILYWTNRAEPMHSWDNVFLKHIKTQWSLQHQGNHNERQQANPESTRTKDRSIAQQLNDRSWAT